MSAYFDIVLRQANTHAAGFPVFEDMPKIDVHTHLFKNIPGMAETMQNNNIRVISVCYGGDDPKLLEAQEQAAEELFQKYRPQYAFCSTFDLTRRDQPDYITHVVQWLNKSFAAGAVMTKIWKDVGMRIKTIEGAYVMPDDPVFDPIYDHLAKRGKPLMVHFGDIKDAWHDLPGDHPFSEYFNATPEWYPYKIEGVPSYDEIIAARNRVLERHPDLVVIGAHMGTMTRDLDQLANCLDRFPNFYVDCSGRTMILSLMPLQEVRDFFIAYQDRILYGTDLMAPQENASTESDLVRFVIWSEENYRKDFQYYAGQGTVNYWGNDVPCLELPHGVLEKFFSKNAIKIIPGLR